MLKDSNLSAIENGKFPFSRLKALRKLKSNLPESEKRSDAVNIQTHTIYSFSPYTPSMAAYMAYKFDLRVAGILDNYTIAGAKEFIEACKILNLTYSVGVELRADFKEGDTPYSNVALFGIAQKYFKSLKKELVHYRNTRRENVLSTLDAVNKKVKSYGIVIDFKKDVKPLVQEVVLSKYVYFALAKKIIERFGEGEKSCRFLIENLKMELTETEEGLLCDGTNPYYVYDMANIISDNYTVFHTFKNYPGPSDVVEFGHKVGAICSYEYVIKRGKVKMSDDERIGYNERLIKKLKELGFDAVSFDPSAFSEPVLKNFKKLLKENELLPLGLTRVEFPRRRFDYSCNDPELKRDMTDAVYAIVGSEISENSNAAQGFISSDDVSFKSFEEKVRLFSKIGRMGDD